MGDDLVAALRAVIDDPARVERDADLSSLTTMRVGGPAAALVRADSVADLQAIAQVAADGGVPWLVIGRGSNMLVADTGWSGIAIALGRGLRGVRIDGASVEAGAAEPMPALARAVAREGLAGLAFGVAIPGTVGGAVRMNAGAHGGEIRDVLTWAEGVRMDLGGAVERWDAAALGFSYRHSALPAGAIVTRARLQLEPADAGRIAAEMAEMRQWRRDHQPINEPSCGSVFRNPPGASAGQLIEQVGLKGHAHGGARISTRHANFITVTPQATAADVYELIRLAQRRVAEAADVELQPEVVLAGFDAVEGVVEEVAGGHSGDAIDGNVTRAAASEGVSQVAGGGRSRR